MRMNVEKVAEKIVSEIMASVGYYSDDKPRIRLFADRAIVSWESGPFEWTMNDGYGEFEELKGYGMPGEYKEKKYWTYEPKGFWVEPLNGCELEIGKE